MRVLMKKTVDGSRNGSALEKFQEGKDYDLAGSARSLELAQVFIREGWAEELKGEAPKAPATKVESGPVYRLPLLPEYVAAGYKPENYEAMIKLETEAAVQKGFVVEVREKNAAELDAEALARKEFEEREKQIEADRAAREAAAAAPSAAPTPPRPPAPPPVTEDSKKKHRR
jgi:hypothetical protein